MNFVQFFNLKGLGIAGAVGAAVGFILGMTAQGALKDVRIHKLEAKYAKIEKQRNDLALRESQRVGKISTEVVGKLEPAVAEVKWKTRTLTERVRVEVPVTRRGVVIDGGDIVPDGALGLLDAGASPEDVTAGRTAERRDPVTFARLTEDILGNYGIARENGKRLDALVEWERRAAKTR